MFLATTGNHAYFQKGYRPPPKPRLRFEFNVDNANGFFDGLPESRAKKAHKGYAFVTKQELAQMRHQQLLGQKQKLDQRLEYQQYMLDHQGRQRGGLSGSSSSSDLSESLVAHPPSSNRDSVMQHAQQQLEEIYIKNSPLVQPQMPAAHANASISAFDESSRLQSTEEDRFRHVYPRRPGAAIQNQSQVSEPSIIKNNDSDDDQGRVR